MKYRLIGMLAAFFLVIASSAIHAETVNINTADAATIASNLDGIGETKAAAIVAYRNEHGLFKSVDELQNVKGIGDVLYGKIKDNVTLKSNAR